MARSLQSGETARWGISTQSNEEFSNDAVPQKVYIVAKEFTRRVLTEERSFSFEHGLADVSLLRLLPGHD